MDDNDWKAIGRKPLQFKKGDIVKRFQEEFFEIREVAENGKTFIVINNTHRGGIFRFNRYQCSLVVPVEWRLDLKDASNSGEFHG